MDNYTNFTLFKISAFRSCLESLSSDTFINFQNKNHTEEQLNELKPMIISFIEEYLDLKKHYKIGEYYNEYKKGKHSLSMFLGYNKDIFLQELNNFTEIYRQWVMEHILPKRISDMSGFEFNQYLEFIGILK